MTTATISEAATMTWHEANQSYLAASFVRVRNQVEDALQRRNGEMAGDAALKDEGSIAEQMEWNFSRPPAMEELCTCFGLSAFERDLLILCAGLEMDRAMVELLDSIDGHRSPLPTFSLALTALSEAHWSALSPERPLRYWQLVELLPAETLVSRPLRINERVLHYLAGVSALDEQLQGIVSPIRRPETLPSSYSDVARRIATVWAETAERRRQSSAASELPVIELCGNEPEAKRPIAAEAAALLNLHLYALNVRNLPQSYAAETNVLLRLWEREALLGSNALLIEVDERESGDSIRANTLGHLLEVIHSPLMISTHHTHPEITRPRVTFTIGTPTREEQIEIWRSVLLEQEENVADTLASHFNLAPGAIRSAAHRAAGAAGEGVSSSNMTEELWNACRAAGRYRFEGLAQRIEPVATWDDLVVLDKEREMLRRIEVSVRQRTTVYERWGFAAKGLRNLGISALFAGGSGTGKTMAAEVLAHALHLDLFRIDLSQVVSKYIGETEKNLSRIFDAAEEGSVVLLFDEADALFGKRTEVKDSHDRYANVEISYLLQRMECYRGLAILTTNRKSALDHAFLRRLRFIIDFPFPEPAQRAEIWRRVFPAVTPTENLRIDRLAQLHASGGNIQNIAMGAAFLAADAGLPVRMEHLLAAARSEFAKLETPLSDAEVAGWV